MKVYDILTPFNYSQTHCVVAKSMGDAERLYKEKYGPFRISKIKLHAEHVIVQREEWFDSTDAFLAGEETE